MTINEERKKAAAQAETIAEELQGRELTAEERKGIDGFLRMLVELKVCLDYGVNDLAELRTMAERYAAAADEMVKADPDFPMASQVTDLRDGLTAMAVKLAELHRDWSQLVGVPKIAPAPGSGSTQKQ